MACSWIAVDLPSTRADEAATENSPRIHELFIRPVNHKEWGNEPAEVQAILESAAHTLWLYFPDRVLDPLVIEPRGGPIVLFRRGKQGEYQIRLNSGDSRWNQWVYQFAHEFCHILSNYDDREHKNQWFEESVCELASLFVLKKLGDSWSKATAPEHWRNYAHFMPKYAADRIAHAQLPKDMTLAQFYNKHSSLFAKNCCDRDRNTQIAVQLLPLFEKNPAHWEAITWLNRAKKGHSESLADYLQAWHDHCPQKHRVFIKQIAERFEIELTPGRNPAIP